MASRISTRCTAFDLLAMGGDDLRDLPMHLRKTKLDRLLARRPDGITVAPCERGESARTYIGRHAVWGWRVWCQNAETGLTVAAGRRTG
jgi:ATP-dependent DNA ligase